MRILFNHNLYNLWKLYYSVQRFCWRYFRQYLEQQLPKHVIAARAISANVSNALAVYAMTVVAKAPTY